jgi:rhamnosyltransferase
MSEPIWVVIRSKNDADIIDDTLRGVRSQTVPARILVLDNASTDGTAEIASRYADRLETVPEGAYVPGRVLNRAMQLTDSDLVVFLNSDCPPTHDLWLANLVAGFTPQTAAVFGRQVPRPNCYPIFARDTESTFGDGASQARWRHCFSMASSAVRRSIWQIQPFSETLSYSEDIDWSWRARQSGYAITYVAESVVEHSHNYTVSQFYRRQRGEGMADAAIFEWDSWSSSWLRYTLLPMLRQMTGDIRYVLKTGASWNWLLLAPVYRLAQAVGRRQGFIAGRKKSP